MLMKRTSIALTLIFALLFSATAGTLIVNLAQANPVVVPIDDLSLGSPQNKNYVQNYIQVSCSYSILDEPVNDHSSMQTSVSYILDGLESESVSNYEIISNKLPNSISYLVRFKITDLPNGSHTLFVHISATADKGFTTFAASSEVVTFTTNTFPSSINPTPSPDVQPFPITIVATASVASITVVAVGLLVYFKKRHIKSGGKHE